MKHNQQDMSEIKDIKELQKTLTNLALQIGTYYKIDLDYSIDSVKKVEEILAKVSEEYQKTKNEEGLKGIALEFAAYIITVIEKNIESGKWERDSKEMGKETFPYKLSDGRDIFPYSWCLKRIYNGEGDNVWVKFQTLILNKRNHK